MILTKKKFKNDPFQTLFNELFNEDFKTGHSGKPKVNILDAENEIELFLAAPGLKKENFNIDLDDNLLTISTSIEKKEDEKAVKFTRKEFDFSTFKRTFTLPETVNAAEIKANYEDGILKLTLPKLEEAKKLKKVIEIS